MTESVYIHIPFCKRKCFYCSFTSIPKTDIIPSYLNALKTDILRFYGGEKIKTLYFGGGTPSLLQANDIGNILKVFNFGDDAEITVEANPDSAGEKFLESIHEYGVNRLSVGVQSFDDKILSSIGRLHNSSQAKSVLKNAINSGFSGVSADFIYGLPGQTQESFLSDLKIAVELGVSHISLYGLKIEEGTPFSKNRPENIADSDKQADMYLAAIDFLTSAGFSHYEISNFSRKNKESRHNLNYWNCGEYYGFGAAAHGYVNGVRYENNKNVEQYISTPLKKSYTHKLNTDEKLEEYVFLGFRRGEGINFSDFKYRFEIDFREKYSDLLEKYRDFFTVTESNCFFKPEGFLVSNTILADFLQ